MSLLSSLASTASRIFPVRATATRRYFDSCHHKVQAGPFRGMNYVEIAHCSALAPKIAGCYERELHPCLEKLASARPDVFVDVGAAEGYYAVGAAFAGWSPRIVAFESEPSARTSLRELMVRNQVPPERIDLREACTPETLAAVLVQAARPAVIIDAEGFEALLLDPLRVPGLERAILLVEYHDFVLPGLSDLLVHRMEPTHRVVIIKPDSRHPSELAGADGLLRRSPRLCRALLSEFRPQGNGWLWFEPKVAPATNVASGQ